MNEDIAAYNQSQAPTQQAVCDELAKIIQTNLVHTESKVWHGGPVWFIDGNPIVGYWVRTSGKVQLLFWSGQSFDEPALKPEGSFKASEVHYSSPEDIQVEDLKRWLKKAEVVQWDYKNIVKRKGVLERLK